MHLSLGLLELEKILDTILSTIGECKARNEEMPRKVAELRLCGRGGVGGSHGVRGGEALKGHQGAGARLYPESSRVVFSDLCFGGS